MDVIDCGRCTFPTAGMALSPAEVLALCPTCIGEVFVYIAHAPSPEHSARRIEAVRRSYTRKQAARVR